MNDFYPIYKSKLKSWIKYWILKGNKIAPKVLSELIEGTTPITIEGVYKGTSLQDLIFKGQTFQEGIPSPETPIPVQVVKEDNYININGNSYRVDLGGKNIFNTQNQTTTWRTTVISKTDNEIIIKPIANGSCYAEYRVDNIKANTQYTISYNAKITGATSFTQRLLLRLREGNTNITSYSLSGNTTTCTFTTTANTDNILLLFYSMNGTDTTWEDIECTYSNIMLCEGTDTNYSPYTANPIELCKIGDYQDKIFKENGTWYLHKEIGKVVLNGSENWSGSPNYYTSILYSLIAPTPATERIIALSNNFLVQGYNYKTSNNLYFHPNKNLQIENPNGTYYATVNDWKTWLSTHNTTVYYVLATPTTEEITETNLIAQLEAIKNATLISGTNEITQRASDLPFILNFKYYMKG